MQNLNIFCCVSGMKLHGCGLQFHCVRVLDFHSFLHNLHLLLFTLRGTFLHLLRYFAALLSSENCYYWYADDFAFFKTCPGHIPCVRGEGVEYNKKSNQGTLSGWVIEPKVCVQRCSCKKMTIWNHNQLVWNQAGIMISWCDVCTDFANLINVVIDVT